MIAAGALILVLWCVVSVVVALAVGRFLRGR